MPSFQDQYQGRAVSAETKTSSLGLVSIHSCFPSDRSAPSTRICRAVKPGGVRDIQESGPQKQTWSMQVTIYTTGRHQKDALSFAASSLTQELSDSLSLPSTRRMTAKLLGWNPGLGFLKFPPVIPTCCQSWEHWDKGTYKIGQQHRWEKNWFLLGSRLRLGIWKEREITL